MKKSQKVKFIICLQSKIKLFRIYLLTKAKKSKFLCNVARDVKENRAKRPAATENGSGEFTKSTLFFVLQSRLIKVYSSLSSSIFDESTQKRRPFLLGKSSESKNSLLHIHGFQRVHPVIHRNILPHFRKDLPVFFGNYIILKAVELSCIALAFVRLIQKRQ